MLLKYKFLASALFYFLIVPGGLSKSASDFVPFDSKVPQSKKVQILSQFFSPPIDSVVEFDPFDVSQFQEKKSGEVAGYIQVTPPKNQCLIITLREHDPDENVCKPRPLKFDLKDLDSKGAFHFTVKTGPDDFGTVVGWRTPYRIARMMTLDMQWPGPIVPKTVVGCEASRTPLKVRKVYVHFLDKEVWTVSFPEKDVMIPQPEEMPRLYVQSSDTGLYILAAEANPDILGQAKAKAKHEGEGGEKDGEKGEGKSVEEKPKTNIFGKKAPQKETITWQIAPRSTYTMKGHFFTGADSMPTIDSGECRYRYQDSEAAAGLMECHYVNNLKWLYLPLTCLLDLQQP